MIVGGCSFIIILHDISFCDESHTFLLSLLPLLDAFAACVPALIDAATAFIDTVHQTSTSGFKVGFCIIYSEVDVWWTVLLYYCHQGWLLLLVVILRWWLLVVVTIRYYIIPSSTLVPRRLPHQPRERPSFSYNIEEQVMKCTTQHIDFHEIWRGRGGRGGDLAI